MPSAQRHGRCQSTPRARPRASAEGLRAPHAAASPPRPPAPRRRPRATGGWRAQAAVTPPQSARVICLQGRRGPRPRANACLGKRRVAHEGLLGQHPQRLQRGCLRPGNVGERGQQRSGVSRAMSRPRLIIPRRWQRSASPIRWVVTSTVVPAAAGRRSGPEAAGGRSDRRRWWARREDDGRRG